MPQYTSQSAESRHEKPAPEYPTAGGNLWLNTPEQIELLRRLEGEKVDTIIPTDSQPAKDASCNNSTEDFQVGVHNYRNLTNVSRIGRLAARLSTIPSNAVEHPILFWSLLIGAAVAIIYSGFTGFGE